MQIWNSSPSTSFSRPFTGREKRHRRCFPALNSSGARYLSGGGSAATVDGVESAYWNPAGLAKRQGVNALFSNRSYIAGMNVNFFGVAMNAGKLGSFGLSGRMLDVGDIKVTDIYHPDGTGEIVTPSYFVVGFTYAKRMSDRTGFGASINYINEGFGRVSASGITVDVGVQYENFLDVEDLDIGVALRNFGNPMRYDGSELWTNAEASGGSRKTDWYKVVAAKFDMPFLMDIGAAYTIAGINLGATYEVNHFNQDKVKLMAEYGIEDIAAIRVGYIMDAEKVKDDLDTPDMDESTMIESLYTGPSFGASLNLLKLTGLDLSIDYALFMTEYFDDNHVIALRFGR
ncbi:PorV/PorQ family protein [bacterium]|nr:PorV/PorQ family protein [bacterium]